MENRLNLEIKDFRLINEANFEINKINVIAGVNGSGKSTLSKFLYAFLKANSLQRRPYFINKIIDNLNYDIEYLNNIITDDGPLELLSVKDGYDIIIKKYEKASKMFDKYFIKFQHHKEESDKKLFDTSYDIYKKLSAQGVDVSSIQAYFNEKEVFYHRDYMSFKKFLNENNFKEYSSILSKMYFENKKYLNSSFWEFKDRKNNFETANRLIENYFVQDDSPYLSRKIANFILCDEGVSALLDLKNNPENISLLDYTNDSKSLLNFRMNLGDSKNFDAFEYFFDNGFLGNVFYVDNVSILDFEKRNSKFKIYHVAEIINSLYPKNSMARPTERYDENTKKILEKIENIIEGQYDSNGYDFRKRKPSNNYMNTLKLRNSFVDKEFNSIMNVHNLPSGIKQIGIIELLLRNYKFTKDCFLIIDEPEVNLHPTWQFKFAEILVLLAKDLNVTVYLNSHSPMFIEAIDAFCEFYDMEEYVNYYLSQKLGNENKYDFVKIKSNQLYKLYDNLGDGYKLINKLRIRKRLSK